MKLIVLDIDGVLSAGDAQHFDLSLFKRLAMLNQLAKTDAQIPSVTLNTGRPSPYVESVMQAIQGWRPALYEHGGGLYFPDTYQFQTSPLLTTNHKVALTEVLSLLDSAIVQTGKAYWQPGKTICHTLLPITPFTIQSIINEVLSLTKDYTDTINVSHTISSVDIHPTPTTKGTGLEWLAHITEIDLSDMGGAGDSSSDVDFLKLIGYPAAPDNAVPDVKAVAQYVSAQSDADGLHDILDYWQLPS